MDQTGLLGAYERLVNIFHTIELESVATSAKDIQAVAEIRFCIQKIDAQVNAVVLAINAAAQTKAYEQIQNILLQILDTLLNLKIDGVISEVIYEDVQQRVQTLQSAVKSLSDPEYS